MTDRLLMRVLPALLLALLAGCACDKPTSCQHMTLSAPAVSSVLYPACHGRSIPVIAKMQPHGSRIESLRIFVTTREGEISSEPPSVRVTAGSAVQGYGVEGSAAVLYFSYPGPCDGDCISMRVGIPQSSPCPYRLRLVPVMMSR